MIAALHQPNFMPYIGFFHKMLNCDVFILMDSVQFSKESWINRVKIKTKDGWNWLTVPVLTKHRSDQNISEVEIDSSRKWKRKVFDALKYNYSKAGHFDDCIGEIQRLLKEDHSKLMKLNVNLIEYLRSELRISTKMIYLSELNVEGFASELLVRACRAAGCDTYLSGDGARSYLDEEVFRAAGIRLVYHGFKHPTYNQLHGGFVEGLSSIDLLLNEGRDNAGRILRSIKVGEGRES
jgi:hypothetical protein